MILKAYEAFKDAPEKNDNRGMAAGPLDETKIDRKIATKSRFRYKPLLQDGTLSKTNYANPVESNVAGYMDGSARIPYCRQTAYTKQHFDKFKGGVGIFC